MKLIYLSAIVTTPNKNGLEKLEQAKEQGEHQINYSSLGIRPPKGDVERDEDGNILLDEEDFEEITVPVTIPIKNLVSWVADVDGGTRVYTSNGVAYDVEEEYWQIDAFIETITMSKLKFNYLLLKSLIKRITGRPENKVKQ
jgi:hypothetical protein|tara:strand:+ start:384 stop:809 length:426 start_codon:yes stop_codon:yes gene_type:complete